MTTYGNIYTKFLIEYDKANAISSYPSLTDYEIATILDKAYLAIIAQKLIGNNPRRSLFESDIKAIEDLRPLVVTTEQLLLKSELFSSYIENLYAFDLSDIKTQDYTIDDDGNETPIPDKTVETLLYFISANAVNNENKIEPIRLINHYDAQKFINSTINIPWIKNPIGYIENNYFCMLYDQFKHEKENLDYNGITVTYIKKPLGFITSDYKLRFNDTEFELNETISEELINLAIIMALETVESSRLQTKELTRVLES